MKMSSENLSEFIEKVSSPIIVCQADSGICSCNDAAALLLGFSRQDMVGQKFSDLKLKYYRRDGTPMVWEDLPMAEVLTQGRPSLGRIIGIKNDVSDSMVWIKMDIQPEIENGGRLGRIILSLNDVSESIERKETDKLVESAKDEWERTVDAIQDLVIIMDSERNVIRANKAAHEMRGFKYGELCGKKCFDVFHRKSGPCKGCPTWTPGMEVNVCTGLVYNDILKRTFEVTSSPIFKDDGKLKYLVYTARDVTQKLKDEAEKHRLMAAIEQLSEVVQITDSKGNIQYVNPAFTDKTGYTRSEAVGQNPRMLKSGEHDDEFYTEMWRTLKSGRVWKGRLINRKKDGDIFWEDATISPVYGSEGEIQNFVAVKRDITKEKSLERQLRHAMKMEAVGTLAGGIAHDFNNILSVMIGYGQMAKGRVEETDPTWGDIDQILMAGDRAVDLVKQILTFSRKDTKEQFKLVKVQYMMKEFLKLLRPSLPMTIELKHSIQEDCRPILGNASQIYQVLMNLCTNAKQAIGGSYGTIWVNLKEIQVAQGDYKIAGLLKGPGEYVELEVIDTGCGMTVELQDRIFEPFFTTKLKDHGTGLGLAVVHGIVKAHEGEIEVDSRVGEGTSFHIYFPVQQVSMDTVPDADELEHTGTGRILIVDDEDTIAQLFERMLRKLGYSPTVFTDSLEAVAKFRKNPNDFDLVLTDMTMPKMTGAELTREVLSLRPELPVIMTTGFNETIDREMAMRLGVREFLLKPVKKEKLSQVVRTVLGDG